MRHLNERLVPGLQRWDRPVDGDAFALAQLAVRTDRHREAAQRLSEILAAVADGAPAPADVSAATTAQASAEAPAPTPAAGHSGAQASGHLVAPAFAPATAAGQPTARAAALLLAEAHYLDGRYDDCLAHCRHAARQQWIPLNDPQAELLRGWILLRRGQARPARALAARLVRHDAGRLDPALRARLLHLRGMCDHRLGKPRTARRALRDATALFRLAGDPVGTAEALNALGVVEKTSVGLAAAAARFEEALRLHRAHGQPGRRAQCLLNLAIVRLKAGETEAALPILREAETLQEQHGGAQSRLRVRIAVARAHLQGGDTSAAGVAALAALATAAEGGFAREEGLALETLGDVDRAEGQLADARQHYDQALAIAERTAPGGDLVAELLRRLGELALAEGDPTAAVAALRRAVSAAGVCGERFEEGVGGHALAMAYLELGQWSRAYRTCRSALSTLRALGAALEAARCELLAARIRFGWWRDRERAGGDSPAADDGASGDATAPRLHLEAAWSYVIEAFHGFDGLGREAERRACAELMDLMSETAGLPGGSIGTGSGSAITLAPGAGACRDAQGLLLPGHGDHPRHRAGPGRLAGSSRALPRIRDPLVGAAPFVARAPSMRRLLDLAAVAAASDEPVLVSGETGTGKELVARLVHERSRRASGPFVPVNCAAIPETLFEREFFGHSRGAYTGADRDKTGLCEAADRGTLFLDEIGDMPTPVQAKLLRLLQEGTFRRLGDPVERHVDLRIVAATNADLPALITERRFRQDLFYRLQTLELPLPPLRERGEDLDALIWLFAARALGRARGAMPEAAREAMSREARGALSPEAQGAMLDGASGISIEGAPGAAPGGDGNGLSRLFNPEVLEAMRRYPWPGNVRELEAMTRRLALMAAHAGRATIEMLPPAIARWRGRPSGVRRELSLVRHLERAERELIAETLMLVDGNRTAAARSLGISRNALYKKMARLGIQIPA